MGPDRYAQQVNGELQLFDKIKDCVKDKRQTGHDSYFETNKLVY